jgi:anti-sigma factor RsiW
MTCRDVLDFLAAYLDGELPADHRAAFDHHLSLCDACRDYIASYRATIRLAQDADPDADAAPPLPDDLVRAIVAARGKGPPGCG